ncbi:hypothetical protein [Mesorhizobium sp. M0496]
MLPLGLAIGDAVLSTIGMIAGTAGKQKCPPAINPESPGANQKNKPFKVSLERPVEPPAPLKL